MADPATTVLIVEDDPDIRELLEEFLVDEGYGVAAATNGAEALAQIEGGLPSIILLDLMMPVMGGVAFLKAFRARWPAAETAIFIVTAAAMSGEARDARALGVRDVLLKPVALDALLGALSTVAG